MSRAVLASINFPLLTSASDTFNVFSGPLLSTCDVLTLAIQCGASNVNIDGDDGDDSDCN